MPGKRKGDFTIKLGGIKIFDPKFLKISLNTKAIGTLVAYPSQVALVGFGSITEQPWGFPGLPAYVVSKHGVVGLTKTAAFENAKKNIRINAVCPGVIHTDMIDRITGQDKEVEKQYINMEPVGRMGNPWEVAEAVMWLCSDAASFVTGHSMPVDGGWIAG